MTIREFIGWLLLALLLGAFAAGWWHWHAARRRERLMRWGNAKPYRPRSRREEQD